MNGKKYKSMWTLLAPALLQVRYVGEYFAPSALWDNTAGTGVDGLITLTDTAAHTFDLGAAGNDTLGELVAAINATAGWEARAYEGLDKALDVRYSTGNWAVKRPSPAPAAAIPLSGVQTWTNLVTFTNAYETVALACNSTIMSARALPTLYGTSNHLEVQVEGNNAGSAGFVTFNFYSNPYGDPREPVRNWDNTKYPLWWGTVPLELAWGVTVAGTAEVRRTAELDCQGVPCFRLGDVTNSDPAFGVKVQGIYQLVTPEE